MTISPTTDRTTGRHERHATAGHIRNRLVSLTAVLALMLASAAFIRAEVTAAWAEPAENVPDLPVELVQVPVPELGLYGRAAFRADPGLSGVSDNPGLDWVAGTYWVREPGGFLRGDPVARGRLLFVSSPTYDTVFVMDLTTGDVVDELRSNERMISAVAVGELKPARGIRSIEMIVWADAVGNVSGRAEDGTASWSVPLEAAVTAPPVMADGLALVTTAAGGVHAFNADGLVWSYPEEGTVAPIRVAAAYAGGVVHAVDSAGTLHLLEVGSGALLCSAALGLPPVGNPVVSANVLYIQSEGLLAQMSAGTCGDGYRIVSSAVDTANPIAVAGSTVYTTDGALLFPFDPDEFGRTDWDSGDVFGSWPAPFYAGSDITTAPVPAGDHVYFGTRAGLVFAVDRVTGLERWRYDATVATGSDVSILGTPVVLDGSVVVTTSGGHVIAIAGEPEALQTDS